MTLAVNERSPEVEALAEYWAVLDALMGGTPTMRAAGVALLPRWPNEESDAYARRLAVSTLFPAYRRTVGVMAAKPFAKALTIDGADARIETWAEDIDLHGVNLHTFAGEMFRESFYGLAGILVDYPRVGPAPQGVRTVAQAEAAGLRPYMVRVRHDQILGWRTAQVGGRSVLTQLRLREDTTVDDGDYGTKCVQRVRVLRPGSWELWELQSKAGSTARDAKSVWTQIDSGKTTLKEIPFVPVYGERIEFMRGHPPLLDLAYLNVKHWQSQSDQDNITNVARVPILAYRGDSSTFELTVGASSAVNLGESPQAQLGYVEHSGAAIGAGKESLAALEEQMIQTGAELLVKKPGDRSATEAAGDQEGNKCELLRMAESFEDALDQALVFMAQYANIDAARAGSASLFKDYGAATLSDASAQLVADLNSRGLLTKETTLKEMQRRGVIEASVDVEAEIEKAAEEGPALGELGNVPGAPGAVPGQGADPAVA